MSTKQSTIRLQMGSGPPPLGMSPDRRSLRPWALGHHYNLFRLYPVTADAVAVNPPSYRGARLSLDWLAYILLAN